MESSDDRRAKIIADQAQREEEEKKTRGNEPEARRSNWAASAPRRNMFKFKKTREA